MTDTKVSELAGFEWGDSKELRLQGCERPHGRVVGEVRSDERWLCTQLRCALAELQRLRPLPPQTRPSFEYDADEAPAEPPPAPGVEGPIALAEAIARVESEPLRVGRASILATDAYLLCKAASRIAQLEKELAAAKADAERMRHQLTRDDKLRHIAAGVARNCAVIFGSVEVGVTDIEAIIEDHMDYWLTPGPTSALMGGKP
jgi:hypothetical protein